MGARPQPASTADKWPGAGASAFPRPPPPAAASSSPSSASSSNPDALASSSSFPPPSATSVEDWRSICLQLTRPPVEDVVSADELLEQGISDYTVSQGVDLLGKGKFSVVYRAMKNGQEVRLCLPRLLFVAQSASLLTSRRLCPSSRAVRHQAHPSASSPPAHCYSADKGTRTALATRSSSQPHPSLSVARLSALPPTNDTH